MKAPVQRELEPMQSGTVVVFCPHEVVMHKQRIMSLFPKKRAVMWENCKPASTEIPSDVVMFVHGSTLPERLRRRLNNAHGIMYATAVRYWTILNS